MKVYGYLELAFKVGRTLTIGGFSGAFTRRTWDEVDLALRDAHHERACPAASTGCTR
jgi:sulfite reductase (NADPH) flavoprotein alpha-component